MILCKKLSHGGWRPFLEWRTEALLPFASRSCTGMGTGGAAPNFSVTYSLKVTLQTVWLLLTQKFWNIPQLLGLCPKPHCTLCIPFSKNTYCIKLYFELDWFFPQFLLPRPRSLSIFAPPTEKSSPCLSVVVFVLVLVLKESLRTKFKSWSWSLSLRL